MIRFNSDYTEGCHTAILEKLVETNMEQTAGYGEDEYCGQARELIRKACGDERVDVRFLVGGTQTNVTVISAALKHYQGVITAKTGHINVHETGAIEATGHKVLPLPSENGKIRAEQIRQAWHAHWTNESHEHLVQPGMVYISFPTEYGTLYTKEELTAIYRVCRECHLPLFIDGARLGYGLMSPKNDVTLQDLAAFCDVFYIGGTKCGALFGEAVVITDPQLARDFRYMIKHNGGMIAKGRLGGVMFLAALEHDDYFAWAKHANEMADLIRAGMERAGIPFFQRTTTNQIFAVLTEEQNAALELDFAYERWAKLEDGRVAVRFVTSWATEAADCEKLASALEALA